MLALANFQLPEEGAVFDKVEFIELGAEEAKALVDQYNKEGRAAFPASVRGGGFRGNRDSRWGNAGGSNRGGER